MERHPVGHRRLGTAEVRQDAQFVEIEVDEAVDDAEGRVEPCVQPAVGAGGFGGVFAPDAEADPDLGDAQRAEDGFRQPPGTPQDGHEDVQRQLRLPARSGLLFRSLRLFCGGFLPFALFAAGAELRFQLSPEAFRFFGSGRLFRRRPLEHRQGEPKRTGPDGQDAALPADVRAERAEQDEGQQHQQDQEQDARDLQQGQQQPAQSHQDSHHVAASPS